MKKLLMMACMLCMFLVPSVTSAATIAPRSEIALGGLGPYATQDYVRSIYGNPSRTDGAAGERWYGKVTYWYYGTGFKISFGSTSRWHGVYDVLVTANNGIKTPSGAHVGMTLSELKSMYGDQLEKMGTNVYSIGIHTEDIYFTVQNNRVVKMELSLDVEG